VLKYVFKQLQVEFDVENVRVQGNRPNENVFLRAKVHTQTCQTKLNTANNRF